MEARSLAGCMGGDHTLLQYLWVTELHPQQTQP